MINFDSFKRKEKSGIPVVVHPASLVQALQILVPSAKNLDETVFALMQMPFVFEDSDPQDNNASLRILSTISRYEKIEDLNVETITKIFTDRALSIKVREASSEEEQLTMIEDAFISHVKDTDEKLKVTQSKFETHKKETQLKEEKLQDALANKQNDIQAKEEQLNSLEVMVKDQLDELEDTRIEKNKLYGENDRLKYMIFYLMCIVGVIFFILSVLLIRSLLGNELDKIENSLFSILPLFIGAPLIIKIITKFTDVMVKKSSNLFKMLDVINKFFWWIYGVIILAIIGDLSLQNYGSYIK